MEALTSQKGAAGIQVCPAGTSAAVMASQSEAIFPSLSPTLSHLYNGVNVYLQCSSSMRLTESL